MHVKFTKVTQQHLNKISEFVYDFTKPTTTAQVREQLDRSLPGRSQLGNRPGMTRPGGMRPEGPPGKAR